MNILLTGGAGYIGSHTAIELLNSNHDVVIVDALYNSSIKVINKIEQITNKKVKFYQIDILDQEKLEKVFQENKIDACIHFAALKAVGKSVYQPLEYYNNNLEGTITLLNVMKKFNCKKLIYSSSATVYGFTKEQPIKEECPAGICTNPYGWTKVFNEQIIKDFGYVNSDWHIILLRYFNPLGAHKSGLIGDNPSGVPSNLMPYITQVAVGKLECLNLFGNDYATHDGTCVRDFVHVLDLASGHIVAMKKFNDHPGIYIYNLGTGIPYSVLDIIHSFEKVSGIKINYKIVGRREGDVESCYANVSKIYDELGWKAKYSIDDMCLDSWNWQKNNPNG